MKKITLSILLIFVSCNAFAQFALGIAGNYNTSLGFDKNWNFDVEKLRFKNEIAHGFSAGIFMRAGKRLFVQPEFMYNFMLSTASAMAEPDTEGNLFGNEGLNKRKIYQHTLTLPVLLGGKLVSTKFFNLRLMAGPRFRFDIGSKYDVATKGDCNITATPRKWQLGLEAGLGFDLGRVTIDGRYILMQDVFAYKFSDIQELKFSPINSFSVGIGVKLVDVKPKNKVP